MKLFGVALELLLLDKLVTSTTTAFGFQLSFSRRPCLLPRRHTRGVSLLRESPADKDDEPTTPSFFLHTQGDSNTDKQKDESKPAANKDDDGLWNALLAVGAEGSLSLIKSIRWGLAQALTASLPDTEKQALLARMQPESSASTEIDEEYPSRGSVAEEAAAAGVQEAVEEGATAKLRQELEAAVAARVQSELQVQKFRLENEKSAWQVENLESEKEALMKQIEALEESVSQMNQTQEAGADENRETATSVQNDLKSIEEMLQKRQAQQTQLDIVEQELKSRASRINEVKAQLDALPSLSRLSPKEYRSLSQEEKAVLKTQRESIKGAMGSRNHNQELEDHPILGPVVADLGYKRIHLVSSGKLGTIPIWKKQRTYRNIRSKFMAAEKQKSMELGFPGIICLYEDDSGGLFILDGQHRIGMMQALRERRNQQAANGTHTFNYDQERMFINVLVEVYPQVPNVTAEAHSEKIYNEINSAEPVKLLDMPGVASAADRKIISEAIAKLEGQFPRMFSESQRCRVPNVNADNLRNAIFGANILRRHKLDTSKKLYDWTIVQNAALGAKFEGDEQRQSYVNAKAWNKASMNGFYLGLESSWLYV